MQQYGPILLNGPLKIGWSLDTDRAFILSIFLSLRLAFLRVLLPLIQYHFSRRWTIFLFFETRCALPGVSISASPRGPERGIL